jgi:hypothetical protein
VAEPHKHKADSDNISIKPPTSDGHGGDRKSEQVKIKSDNITLDPGRGQMGGNEPTKLNAHCANE